MTNGDVERLKQGYEAFRQGGLEAILDWLAPDIVAVDRESAPDRATYHGVEGMRDLFEATSQAFGEISLEPEEFVPVGEHIVVSLRQVMRGRISGAEITGVIAHVWTMREGRPVKLRVFRDKFRALEALGGESE